MLASVYNTLMMMMMMMMSRGVVHRSRSRDKPVLYTESDTEAEYTRRLNVRLASPSQRSEVTQGRSRTLQRPARTTAAAAAADNDGVDGRVQHHRQTSLPHTTSSGLFILQVIHVEMPVRTCRMSA